MAAPPSQTYRTIGFYLTGGSKAPVRMNLTIRPEDLTRREPSRLFVEQTLGGAWADAFGGGVSEITLSGTTGWRGSAFVSGEDAFQALRSTVYQSWHDRRAVAVASGIDPETVKLIFTDNLDSIASVVAPQSFTLRRSRSSPLLMRYDIHLVELGPANQPSTILDSIINALSDPMRWIAGVTGMGNALQMIDYYASEATAVMGALGAAPQLFVSTGTSLMQSVASTAQSLAGQFDATTTALLTAGATFAQAGRNAFAALAGTPGLNNQQSAALMALSASYNDLTCTMANSFNIGLYFQNLDALLGASGCSSTGGGDPPSTFTVSGQNPFYSLAPATPSGPIVTITEPAAQALDTLRADPLLLLGQNAMIGSLMQAAATGITVSS